jgi:uncharacterized protein (DUF433 family)
MTTQIIDRGRGPEVAGTRVTVYRIMDFVREGAMPDRIAAELNLTTEQVHAALDYIDQNRTRVDGEYQAILNRLRKQQASSNQVSVSPEELKRRIRLRDGAAPHARTTRQ